MMESANRIQALSEHGFDVFISEGRVHRPCISIGRAGLIGVNRPAARNFSLDEADYIVLMYDDAHNRIAIVQADADTRGAIKVRRRPKGGGIDFAGRAFLERHNIPYEGGTRRLRPAPISQELGVLVVELESENECN